MSPGASRRGVLTEVRNHKKGEGPVSAPAQLAEVGGSTATAELSRAVFIGRQLTFVQPWHEDCGFCTGNCCICTGNCCYCINIHPFM